MLELRQNCEPPRVFSIAEVADVASERLGRRIRPGAIRYLIASGKLADVARAGGKRVFTDEDITRVQAALEGRLS